MAQPWFSVKTHGVGLSPSSPAGWTALAVFLVTVALATALILGLGGPSWLAALVVIGLSAGFFVIVLAKSDGQPWRWRWGDR